MSISDALARYGKSTHELHAMSDLREEVFSLKQASEREAKAHRQAVEASTSAVLTGTREMTASLEQTGQVITPEFILCLSAGANQPA